jgi:hypothetical protein
MKQVQSLLFACVVSLLPLVSSCGSSGGGPSVTCTNGTIEANEVNDYAFSSTLTLASTQVAPQSNLTFNWGGVTTDFLGHPVTATNGLDTMLVLIVNLSLADFETQINTDVFSQSSLIVLPPPLFAPPAGVVSGTLFDNFTVGGVAVTPDNADMYLDPTAHPPDQTTFILAGQTGMNTGNDIRMMQAFQIDPTSSNTAVTLSNSSTSLNYHVDMHSLHPTGVPANTPALTLDWSQLNMNAFGDDISDPLGVKRQTDITSAIVGHYTQSVSQLESQFLNIQTIATDLYSADIPPGTTLDFATLQDSAGNAFPGVDANGTWLVALLCGGCRNPAPYYLTILKPVAQPCPSTN